MTKQAEPCFNCGAANGDTRDHVFPRALFPTPRPANLLTVPCCISCQASFQPDEGYFRDLVAGGAYSDPQARALWDGPVQRSFARDPKARAALADGLRRMEFRSPAGLFLGELVGVEGDQGRIGAILRKIVRGLFFLDLRTPMPDDVHWSFEQVSPISPPVPDEARELVRGLPLRSVGTEVRFKFGVAQEEPRLTITWMAFYSRTMFLVGTLPGGPSIYDEPDAESVSQAGAV